MTAASSSEPHLYPGHVAVLYVGELRSSGEAHIRLLQRQCAGSSVWIVTYRAFESLALRLTGNNTSRILFVSGLQPDANHTISFTEANRLRTEAGLPSMADPPSTMVAHLKAKGKLNHDGTPSPSTTQQWASMDAALQRFGAEMLRAGATTIVRSRTDVMIGPAPYGSPSFRYASLGRLRAGVVCASSDRVFYAESRTFLRVLGDFWYAANTRYAGLPTDADAALLADRVARHRARQTFLPKGGIAEAAELGCNAVGPPAGHNYAWRKLPRNASNASLWVYPPDWSKVGPESLAFHSEQAFAYHVMVTMGAWCNICDMHGKGTSVNLHANRAECSSLPTEAAKSSSCHQAASRPVGNATKPHSRRLSELGSGTSWSDAQATITRVFGELAAVGGLRPFGSAAEARRVLLPLELCWLRNGSATKLVHSLEGDRDDLSECNAPSTTPLSCYGSNDAFVECGVEHEERARRLLSRYHLPRWSEEYPGFSHLAHAELDSLYFIGDSVTQQLKQLAKCELQRDAAASDGGGRTSSVRVLGFPQISDKQFASSVLDGLTRNLSTSLAQLAAKPSGGVHVAVAIFPALHLNTPPGGAVQLRAQYRRQLHALLAILSQFTRSCRRCHALFLTPTSQHFQTADGSGAYSKYRGQGAETGCKPVHVRLPPGSPNSWRATDAIAAASRWPRVLTVPLHQLTVGMWDLHPGYRENVRAADCTHFCYGRLAFEPVWWAVRLAAIGSPPRTWLQALSSN